MINITKIRQQLLLQHSPYDQIPDQVLLTIFQPTSRLEHILTTNYQLPNTEALEYLGDSVLDLIVNINLISLNVTSPGNLTRYRDTLVKNQSLQCYMNSKNLCQFVNRNSPKACADVFEILVGTVYWYLAKKLNLTNAIDLVELWLDQAWKLKFIITNLVKNNKLFCYINAINTDGVDGQMLEVPYENEDLATVGNDIDLIKSNNINNWQQALEQAYLAGLVPDGNYQDLLNNNYIKSIINDASTKIIDRKNKRLATDLFNYLIYYKTTNLTIPTVTELNTFNQDLLAILANQIEPEDAIPIILRLLKFNGLPALQNVDLTSVDSFSKSL